jgi:hypothetical protein
MFCFINYNENTNMLLAIGVYGATDDKDELQ